MIIELEPISRTVKTSAALKRSYLIYLYQDVAEVIFGLTKALKTDAKSDHQSGKMCYKLTQT